MASNTFKKPIGLGFVGLTAQQYKLVAVSTSRTESAEESSKSHTEKTGHAVKGYHGSTAAIAADPDVQFVAVSVKAPDHAAAIKPVLAAKKDVFSEWPLGKNLEETRELAVLAKEAGVRTLIGTQAWQSPVVNKVRTWITEGKIGRVLSVTWIASKPNEVGYWAPTLIPGAEFALEPANGATLLSIIGGHDLTAVTRMVGPISSVSATTGKLFPTAVLLDVDGKPTDTVLPHTYPDNIALSGSLANHPGAVVNAFWRTIPVTGEKNIHRPSLLGIIDGEEGVVRFEVSGPTAGINIFTPAKVYLNNEEVAFDDTPFVGNTGRNWEEFAKGEKGDYPTWDDAVKLHELIHAIEKSAEKGVRITVGA